jgi:hypothetical protein
LSSREDPELTSVLADLAYCAISKDVVEGAAATGVSSPGVSKSTLWSNDSAQAGGASALAFPFLKSDNFLTVATLLLTDEGSSSPIVYYEIYISMGIFGPNPGLFTISGL